MSEPIHKILSAHFTSGLGLEVIDADDVHGPALWNYEVADLAGADRFIRDSNFRRTEEWMLGDDNEYVADVEFLGGEESIDIDGIEAARLIDLAAVDGAAPGAMEPSPQRTVEAHQKNLDHGADLE